MTSHTVHVGVKYLMQIAFGVTQEDNAMPLLHTDGHSGKTGRWVVQYRFGFNRLPARHRTGGVVWAARVSIQGVLVDTKTCFHDKIIVT